MTFLLLLIIIWNPNITFILLFNYVGDLANRPRLNLKPRSVPNPVNSLADTASRSSIFGQGKPRVENEDDN